MTDAQKNNVIEFLNANDPMAAVNYVGSLLNLEMEDAVVKVDEIVLERRTLAAAVNTPIIRAAPLDVANAPGNSRGE